MRLLRSDLSQGFKLDEFNLENAPPYAILSHRWGANEVLLGDLTSDDPKDEARFAKIIGCCMWAREHQLTHVWIDTCCIDQKSSSELSESINSMFLWYTKAAICFVHLKDVFSKQDPEASALAFRRSEWFTRGWTLQELIAPQDLVFFTQGWDVIGNKRELAGTIENITKISYGALCNYVPLANFSVAEKMSWASNRKTTKVEDRAYSLLGIFGANMPTIYGEGQTAFQRLQYEIIAQSNDYSIFAWDIYSSGFEGHSPDKVLTCGLLAPSPDSFANSAVVVALPFLQFASHWGYQDTVADIQRTNTGIRLNVPIFEPSPRFTRRDACVMIIPCKKREQPSARRYYTIGVVLRLDDDGYYNRLTNTDLHDADRLANLRGQWKIETIDVHSAKRRDPIDNDSPGIVAHVHKPYEIVLKAHTLSAFRSSLSPVPFEGCKVDFLWCDKVKEYVEEHQPGLHTWEWVEDPETKEKDLVVKVQCGLEGSSALIHRLFYSWQWGDKKIKLMISIRNGVFVVCDEIYLGTAKPSRSHTDWTLLHNDSSSALKNNNYWSVDVPNRGTVDILMTLTDVAAKMVRYEVDLMIHADSAVKRLITKSSRFIRMRSRTDSKVEKRSAPAGANTIIERSGPKHYFRKPVQWVPACLGDIPKGAYALLTTIGGRKCYVSRGCHKGTIKLGFLWDTRPWTTLISPFDNLHSHPVCDYEVLIGTSGQLDWVEVEGPFTLEALRGAKPVVVSGGDGDDISLYVARSFSLSKDFGTVRIGSHAHMMDDYSGWSYETKAKEEDKYKVLVYKQ